MLIKQEIIEQIDDDLQVVHHVVAPTPQYVSPSVHIETLNKLVTSLERERDEAKELANRAEEESRRVNAMEAERKRKANEYQKNRRARIEAEKKEAKREEKRRSKEVRKKNSRSAYHREYRARKKAEKEEERRREEQKQWRGALRSETMALAQAEQDSVASMEQEAVQEVRALDVAPMSAEDAPRSAPLQQFQNNVQSSQSHQQLVPQRSNVPLLVPAPQVQNQSSNVSPPIIISSQLEASGATISHNSEKDSKKELKLVFLDNFSLLSKVNRRNEKIPNLQKQLHNALREMEGQKWALEGLKKALETKDSMLKSIKEDRDTHEKEANEMKRKLEKLAQTRRNQELEMIYMRKRLENKKIEKAGISKIHVSRIPLPPPRSSPSNLYQSMKKTGKSSGNVTRSRPH